MLDDVDLSHLSRKSHRELCGKKLGLPQNPMTAFDSRLKIGFQIRETFTNRLQMSSNEAMALAREKTGCCKPERYGEGLGAYPSELSGGMLQE